jgi:predicted ATPase
MARIVITGGPGAGKTTLLLALQARGHAIVDDSARAIIQGRRTRGLGPRPSAAEFAQEILRMDAANFIAHAATPGNIFFERSVVDALCGLDAISPLNDSELSGWLSEYRYCPRVFILPPWQAIYVNDAERDQSFEHSEAVFQTVRQWYLRCGYQLIEVPRVPVPERAAFVLQALAGRDS